MDWFSANLQSTGLQPQWNNAVQTVYNGNVVVEVPTSRDAALFFTKVDGVLHVDAYKWLDKSPGDKTFTGNIIDYSFNSNVVAAYVYNKGIVLKQYSTTVPAANLKPVTTSNPQITTTNPATILSVKSARQRTLVLAASDGGPGTWFAYIGCILSGGTWTDGYGAGGCNVFGDKGGWLNGLISFFENLFNGGGGGGSSSSDDGTGTDSGSADGTGDGSAPNVGSSYSYIDSNDGSTVNISVASGGAAYVTINNPCNPNSPAWYNNPTNPIASTTLSLRQGRSLVFAQNVNSPCGGGYTTTQWVPVPIIPPISDSDLGNSTPIIDNKPSIDPVAYKNCFNDGKTASSYVLTIYIDQPNPGYNDQYMITGGGISVAPGITLLTPQNATLDVGHAFVSFTKNNTDGSSITQVMGFYLTVSRPYGKGAIKDDTFHPYSVSFSAVVSSTDFNAALNDVIYDSVNSYYNVSNLSATEYNCTDAAISWMKAASVTIPIIVPRGIFTNTPGDYGQALRAFPNSSSTPVNITAPVSHGPCN